MRTLFEYHFETFGAGNTLADINFDQIPWLSSREPVVNPKGQRVSKSYYDNDGREVVRQVYTRIMGTHTFNGVEYPDTFLGLRKEIHYLDVNGDVVQPVKYNPPYYFTLEPVFVGDGMETLVGFSSAKQRHILKQERIAADAYLQGKNPSLYAYLYAKYGSQYDFYLKTGIKADLVSAIEDETDEDVIAVLDNIVYGEETKTVRDLIIASLQ